MTEVRSGDAVQAIVDRLRPRADDITRAMVERYRREIPEYAALSGEVLSDTFRVSLDNLHILLSNMPDAQALDSHGIARVRIAALRRAREGVPLEAMLRAYRLWARTVWSAVIEDTDTSVAAEAEAALRIGTRIMEHADRVATAVTQAYRDESAGVTHIRDVLGRDVLERLITDGADDVEARELLARSGRRLHDGHCVLILRRLPEPSAAGDAVPEPLSAALVRRYLATLEEVHLSTEISRLIVGVRDDEIVALYPMDDANGLDRLKQESMDLALALSQDSVAVGVGEWHPGLDGISKSYIEAKQATDVAVAGNIRGRSVAFSDVLIDHLLPADAAAGRVIAGMVDALEAYDAAHSSSLMQTLGAYFAAGFNLTRAASTLFVGPNTVVYRLKRIRELTGRDPLDPNDLLLLVLAWKLKQAD